MHFVPAAATADNDNDLFLSLLLKWKMFWKIYFFRRRNRRERGREEKRREEKRRRRRRTREEKKRRENMLLDPDLEVLFSSNLPELMKSRTTSLSFSPPTSFSSGARSTRES